MKIFSEDFQRIYELYKKEGVPNGISIVNFCQQNGVVYPQFEKWFKSRKRPARSSVHPVQLVDKDGLMASDGQTGTDESSGFNPVSMKESPLRFGITVRTNQGLSIQQNNLTYRQLLHLVEKLEALC